MLTPSELALPRAVACVDGWGAAVGLGHTQFTVYAGQDRPAATRQADAARGDGRGRRQAAPDR